MRTEFTKFFYVGLWLLATGCSAVKPLKPGTARITLSQAGVTNRYELTQSENPAHASSQNSERVQRMELPLAAGSVVQTVTPGLPISASALTNPAAYPANVTLAAPAVMKIETIERTGTVLGAAQKDTSRELSARFAAMRPVQWAGVLLILGAVALAYFGWWTPAGIASAAGMGMIVLAQVLPGHEWLILAGGVAVAALGVLVVFYAYNSGRLDPYLPDALDKKRKVE